MSRKINGEYGYVCGNVGMEVKEGRWMWLNVKMNGECGYVYGNVGMEVKEGRWMQLNGE